MSADAASRRWRRIRRGDIQPVQPLRIAVADWSDPAAALESLRSWTEQQAAETINWYLRDKQFKRWGSRLLRAAAVVFAVTGGMVPLIADESDIRTGYVLLALAAGCVGFDHFFGLSAGWMRDITTAQALQGQLSRFQVAWATWQAAYAGIHTPDEPAAPGVAPALVLLDGLIADVVALTSHETAQWVDEFSASMASLRRQTVPPGTPVLGGREDARPSLDIGPDGRRP
jgi:hypothetical protein